MSSKREKFVIIDGNALIHRAFHALPPLTTKKGEMVNAVFGFTSVLLTMFKELKPDYLAATFDLAGPTFRHTDFADYKATRIKAPQDLYDQIPRVKDVVRAFNIPIFEQEGFEADDLIGSIVTKLHGKPLDVMIVTGDMDTLQLVDGQTEVYTLKKGVGETTIFGPQEVQERYGLRPDQMIDYKALRGDPSDNIPGVPGIGEKTARALLRTFGTLDALYAAIDGKSKKISGLKPRVLELLVQHRTSAAMSRKLATIVRAVPIHFALKDCHARTYDRQKVVALLQELEFKSLLARLPALTLFREARPDAGTQQTLTPVAASKPDASYHVVTDDAALSALLRKLRTVQRAAVDTETTGLDVMDDRLLGVSIAWKPGEAYYVDVRGRAGATRLERLRPFLENPAVQKIGHNMKFDDAVLRQAGIAFQPLTFDSMIASYLLSAGTRQHNLDTLVFSEFGYEMMPITALIGPKGKAQVAMEDVPVEKLGWYSCEDADYTLRLAGVLAKELEEQGARRLFEQIEMPLVRVLADMELAGVKIDTRLLAAMSRDTAKKIAALERHITAIAGSPFNINSPVQLKEVLFQKLRISTDGVGKTKTGFSTAAAELEKMRDAHPVIEKILEYRELAKLRSTYLEALPQLVHRRTGRVHTDFNQTVTATGRLSSSDPNLQNIPVRTDLGRKIRTAFVADRGFRLLSADYSQIELRLVAALAKDTKMLAAFRRGEDIHARTAAEIHGIPLENVTKEIRRTAKEVNFGVLYGMGAFGLAERTGIARGQARAFIERYFAVYQGVAAFLERTKALAKSRGYVETLFSRRRAIPEINSAVAQVRNAAERMAVNMPVQGTAADLMKLAMIAVHERLPAVSPKSRMILQVHDELVFEVPSADVERVAAFVKKTMEGAAEHTPSPLAVPIVVDISVGENWGEMERV